MVDLFLQSISSVAVQRKYNCKKNCSSSKLHFCCHLFDIGFLSQEQVKYPSKKSDLDQLDYYSLQKILL